MNHLREQWRQASHPWAPSGVWYHGSWKALPLGTVLVPGGPGGDTDNFTHIGDPAEPVVWLTKDPHHARLFVDIYHANEGRRSGDVYIYRVEPLGQVYPMDIGEWATPSARIVEIVEQPDHAPLVAKVGGSITFEVNEHWTEELGIDTAIVLFVDGEEIGHIVLAEPFGFGDKADILYIAGIEVYHEEDRRKGYATMLLERAKQEYPNKTIIHDSDLSPDAQEWIKSLPTGQRGLSMDRSQLVTLSMAEDAFEDRLGRCYELSGRYVVTQFGREKGLFLIHGSIEGMGNPRIGHAWVEQDGQIYDPVANEWFDPQVHEGFFKAIEDFRYTPEEVRIKTTRSGHWGPWDYPNGEWEP